MTLQTLQLLRQMLANQQLQVGAPNFTQTAQAVIQAVSELDAEIAKHTPDLAVDIEN